MWNRAFLVFMLMCGSSVFAQDTLIHSGDTVLYTWVEEQKFPMRSADAWSVDKLQNVYISDGASIKKYDSTGVLKFRQSVKSFGHVTQLAPINSMKLVYFSQQQQTLCFLDNTLSVTEDCLDLADYDIYNAEWIATSTRPELLWVYDNDNSTLKLISLNSPGNINLEIVNVNGILGLDMVSDIFEAGQHLYVMDENTGVYQMDFYGGLLRKWDSIGEIDVAADEESHLFRMRSDDLVTQGVLIGGGDATGVFKLPLDDILQFEVMGNHLYFRTKQTVHKYTLQFNK
ncbi:MAG: hypothetical protein ACFHU9_15555 [Fluviicola sp.]